MSTATTSTKSGSLVDTSTLWKVIWASSLGTLIEWYDFYIFGSLASNISKEFFPSDNPTASLLSTLATFAVGFLVRPFGALVFGRLGDLIGRKYTFLLTLILMGGSTFAIGLVPGYKAIGFAAPLIVILLRVIQGLALGGEYGGAATYVSEHVTSERRGYYTSFIQTTATIGLFLSLVVIFFTKQYMGAAKFAEWGWRVPFLISIFLVIISIYIRLKMNESPVFSKLKKEGKTAANPLKESFGNKENLKMVLLALFGAVAGQGVVWYTGQFYAMSFIQNVMKVEDQQRLNIMMLAIALATPFFIVFASLSDKIGRKWIMLGGIGLAALCMQPIYKSMFAETDAKAAGTQVTAPMVVETKADNGDLTKVTTTVSTLANGTTIKEVKKEVTLADTSKPAPKAETTKTAWLSSAGWWKVMWLVFIQIVFVTMAYGPIAAFLVELFPSRIRYSSMSLPYHIGNGVFGGLVPFIGTALTQGGTLPFNGLYYPMGVAILTVIIGAFFIPTDHRHADEKE